MTLSIEQVQVDGQRVPSLLYPGHLSCSQKRFKIYAPNHFRCKCCQKIVGNRSQVDPTKKETTLEYCATAYQRWI